MWALPNQGMTCQQHSAGLSLGDVIQARQRIAPFVVQTPVVRNADLDSRLGTESYWKLETLQRTNSFKVRGALNRILGLDDREASKGIVAASSGNHGIGVGFAAELRGIRAVVVMPKTASPDKQHRTSRHGAKVIVYGAHYNEALAYAKDLSTSDGMTLVSSSDDVQVVAGQGTVALELLEQVKEFDTVVVPVGSGGLIASIGLVLKNLAPHVKVIGVQTRAAPSGYESFKARKIIEVKPSPTLADGIVGVRPGDIPFEYMLQYVDDMILVDEEEIARAVCWCAYYLKIVAEPAAATSLAALLGNVDRFSNRRVVGILTGANIDLPKLASILEGGRSLLDVEGTITHGIEREQRGG